MGIVADRFWRLPGVLRSDSPHAFAAIGPAAAHHGEPSGRHPARPRQCRGACVELDGRVLLLGVGHDANTTIHLAEMLAGVRYRRQKYLTVMLEGQPARLDYREVDHCCENFNLIDGWLDPAEHRIGVVGRAQARLVRARHVVEIAVEHLRSDETAFLHPLGVDVECDEAWASLVSPGSSRARVVMSFES